jgi:hypothetical protein
MEMMSATFRTLVVAVAAILVLRELFIRLFSRPRR